MLLLNLRFGLQPITNNYQFTGPFRNENAHEKAAVGAAALESVDRLC